MASFRMKSLLFPLPPPPQIPHYQLLLPSTDVLKVPLARVLQVLYECSVLCVCMDKRFLCSVLCVCMDKRFLCTCELYLEGCCGWRKERGRGRERGEGGQMTDHMVTDMRYFHVNFMCTPCNGQKHWQSLDVAV